MRTSADTIKRDLEECNFDVKKMTVPPSFGDVEAVAHEWSGSNFRTPAARDMAQMFTSTFSLALQDGNGSPTRMAADRMVRSLSFRAFMAIIVMINSVQVVVDAEVFAQCKYHHAQDACDLASSWLDHFNWLYLFFYCAELVLKAYAYHLEIFCNPWNIFDIVIVATGIITQVLGNLPSVGILRLLRLMRLAKALRLVKLPTELNIMFQGFFSALTAISFGVIVVAVMLLFWAVIGVVLIAPVSRASEVQEVYLHSDCGRCLHAWTSIWDATVTLFGLLMFGEGFESMVVPLLTQKPWTIVYFTAAIFTVVHGMVNLILAVIVDKANQVHIEESDKVAKELQAQHDMAITRFMRAFSEMDGDNDGKITSTELCNGYDKHQDIKDLMNLNNIRRQDLKMLFSVVNKEDADEVDVKQFTAEFMKVKDDNLHVQLAFVQRQVVDLQKDIKKLLVVKEDSGKLPGCTIDLGKIEVQSHVEKKEEKSCLLKMPSDADIDSPWPFESAQIEQLRQNLHSQAKQVCDNLEQQARLLVQSEHIGAEFAAALQRLGGQPSELLGREEYPACPPASTGLTSPSSHRRIETRSAEKEVRASSEQDGLNALDNVRVFSLAYASIDKTKKAASADSRKKIYDV